MNTKPLTVIAQIKAKLNKEDHVRRELLLLIPPTRKETGCLNYDLHQSADDSALFLFHENWASKADLDRHLKARYVQTVLAKVSKLLAEPPQITLWKRIA